MKAKIFFLAITNFIISHSMEEQEKSIVQRSYNEWLVDLDARLAAQHLNTIVKHIKQISKEPRPSFPLPKAPSS